MTNKAKNSTRRLLGSFAAVAMMVGAAAAMAAEFDSGSDGSDGALDFTGVAPGTTILFDPTSFDPPLDPDGDNVYHFTTVTIPAGVTVKLRADVIDVGVAPVVWLSTGAMIVHGDIDANGEDGQSAAGASLPRPSVAGAGGYGAGIGGRVDFAAEAGSGPGGGGAGEVSGTTSRWRGGVAGHRVPGGSTHGGSAYGNDFLLPLLGGSGGGGGAYAGSTGGGGGGAGGGALLLASSVRVQIEGTVSANGGVGGDGECGGGGWGGGGSGGAIRILAPSVSGNGIVRTLGGRGGCGVNLFGSNGRVRVESFTNDFTGVIGPLVGVSSPGLVFQPASAATVRVVSIAGIDVPAQPTGSFETADVTVDDVTTADINIEANNIPLGTVVRLTLFSENGPTVNVDSTPLAGTVETSTATASASLPHGFSRFEIRADWTPVGT